MADAAIASIQPESTTNEFFKRQIDTRLWPFMAGFICTLFLFWPGIVTHDAAYQYLQISQGFFGNWHPPFMNVLWAMCDRVWHGPALFFMIQSSIIWIGLCNLSLALRRCGIRSGIFLFALGLSPLLMEVGATLSTDSLFLGFLILGAAWTLSTLQKTDEEISPYLWSYGALVCAYLSREYNAVPSIIPFLVLLGCRLSNGWMCRASIIILMLLSLPLFGAIERGVLNVAAEAQGWGGKSYGITTNFHEHPENVVLLHDLAGISVESGHDVYPAFIRLNPKHSLENLKRCYTPNVADPLYFDWSSAGFPDCSYARPLVVNRSLIPDWLEAIYHEPVAYLIHRLRVNRHFLQISVQENNIWPIQTTDHLETVLPNEQVAAWTTQQHVLLAAYQAFCQVIAKKTPVFKPYFWGLLGLLLLLPVRKTHFDGKTRGFVLALVCSGLIQIPVLAVIAPAAQYRYWSWTVIAVALAAYITVKIALKRRPFILSGTMRNDLERIDSIGTL